MNEYIFEKIIRNEILENRMNVNNNKDGIH